MKNNNKKLSLEKEREVVFRVAKCFADKHKDIKIYKDGELLPFEFFSNYNQLYKIGDKLIQSQSDRKIFIVAMDNFFMEYFTDLLKKRVEAGESRKDVEMNLKMEANKFLNYILHKQMVQKWQELVFKK